ncbi:glycoside hydrolase family 73 protein [Paenibacillus vini]|uniref:Mannosyl-glycoprotein endo-beta-N-acetylglucosamidase-like domain-containing protein n=1 Tax=Paenibacillus vini TaxID=1476024 RepID=A0ABQ4MAT8_9BACL|nr:glucosaminidase domain-containing protein [Paenibacillus vini]GIP53101.1 hypothetical protein J42TS3_21360 [Paenibacillus vini]
MNKSEFIAKIAPHAVADMRKTGVAASLTIAQAALESGWGGSGLTKRANNLFGIKGAGPAGKCVMPTREYSGGKWITVDAAFRAYRDWGESIADHSALFLRGVSWDRNKYRGVIGKRGAAAARAVAAAGYATDPDYAAKLIAIMDAHNLYDYDTQGEAEPKVTKDDANKIINTWLKPAYGAAKTVAERKEIGRLADELRVASGQPKQNG